MSRMGACNARGGRMSEKSLVEQNFARWVPFVRFGV
jgi:hypothetical protein